MINGLRFRLTVIFISLAILPAILVGAIIGQRSYSDLKEQNLELQREVVKSSRIQIMALFEEWETDLLALDELSRLGTLEYEEQRSILNTILLSRKAYQEIALLNSQGMEQIHLSRSRIFLEGDLKNRSEKGEFLSPFTRGATYYSLARFDDTIREPLITISIPLFDRRSGKIVSVLVADLRIKAVWDLMADIELPDNGIVYVVDQAGMVVAHKNPAVVLSGTTIVLPVEEGRKEGLSGTDVIIASESLPLGEQTFYVVSEQPASAGLEKAVNNLRITVMITFIALSLAGILVVLTIRQIVKPIEMLSASAQSISSGDFSQQVKIPPLKDEIADLSHSFNIMARSLKEREEELQIQNVALQTEIARRVQAGEALHVQRDIGIALGSISHLREALDYLLEATFQIEGIDCGGVYLVDTFTGELNLENHKGLSNQFVESTSHYASTSSQTRMVMAGKPIYFQYPEISSPVNRIPQNEGLQAAAIIPISSDGQVIAALNLASNTLDKISVNSRHALEAIASQIGTCISRIRAEEAMRESQKNLQTLFNTIDDFLFILDEEGSILQVNPVVQKRLGYLEEEINKMGVLQVHPPDRRDEAAAIVADMLAGKSTYCPVPLMTNDGTLIPVETKISLGKWDGRNALFGISRDITERKRAEDALIASQKMASQGTLAAGIAHELNSPLQIVTGSSESLIRQLEKGETVPGDRLQNSLEMINRNGWRSAQIVRSLLTYARASQGMVSTNDLNTIIKETLLLIEHQLKSWSNISVTSQLSEEIPSLVCDREQISQVLINLLTNARDAMPEGGEITINTLYIPDEEQIILQVSDTGTGIPEDVLVKIFDPFFTTKPPGEGTGLGLSLTQGIIQAHNGSIEVDSQIDRGTTIRISIPTQFDGKTVPKTDHIAGRYNENIH